MRLDERDAGFTEFVAARQIVFRRVAYAICGDWDQAEDLLQQALTKLYLAWPRIRRRGAEDAYLRKALLSTHIDATRRRASRPERLGLEVERGGDQVGEPVVAGTAPEERDALIGALQELPEMQRKVVVLRHLLDLPIAQVATELGIGAGTVKSHDARGLARLRQLLDETPDLTRDETPGRAR